MVVVVFFSGGWEGKPLRDFNLRALSLPSYLSVEQETLNLRALILNSVLGQGGGEGPWHALGNQTGSEASSPSCVTWIFSEPYVFLWEKDGGDLSFAVFS